MRAADFIDPHGPFSQDMFEDATPQATQERFEGYLAQAVKKAARVREEAREDAVRAWVYHLAYERLAAMAEARAASESQPEYQRSMLAEQIRALRRKADQYEDEFQAYEADSVRPYSSSNLSRV